MADYPTLEERGAARKYLEHDHAAQTLDGPAGDAAERNASDIDEEYPRAFDIAATGTARELGEIPKHLKAHQQTLRRQAGINAEQAARLRAAYRAGPPDLEPDPQPQRQSAARRSAPARRSSSSNPVRSAASYGSGVLDTIAPATKGWGSLIAEVFAWGIGLSLLAAVLNRAAGVAPAVDSVAKGVRAIVSPHIDPLNPNPAVHVNLTRAAKASSGAQPRAATAAAHS